MAFVTPYRNLDFSIRRERERQEEADLEFARELEKLEIEPQKEEEEKIAHEQRRLEEQQKRELEQLKEKILTEQAHLWQTIKRYK